MEDRRASFRLLEVGLVWPPETFLQRKLRGLAARGVHVTVASPIGRREARRQPLPGVRLVRLHTAREPRLVSLVCLWRDFVAVCLRNPRLLVRLIRATRPRRLLRNVLPLARQRPDIVQLEWEGLAVLYLPMLEVFGVPVVVSCHGSGISVHPHVGLERVTARYPAVFAKAAVAHCVSEAMRDEAIRYGLDPAKARVIRAGVDSAFFSPVERATEPQLRVLSVGGLHWIKNLEDGIKAVALLAEEGIPVRYDIVGEDPPPGDPVKSAGSASSGSPMLSTCSVRSRARKCGTGCERATCCCSRAWQKGSPTACSRRWRVGYRWW
jgi:glycosyltransferase involved in cell wall biosynthesis